MKAAIILTILVTVLLVTTHNKAQAAFRIQVSTGTTHAQIDDNESSYYSTTTCSNSNLSNAVIHPVGAKIFSVDISSAGGGLTKIYDASTSSSQFTANNGDAINTGARLLKVIDNRQVKDWPFQVGASSGIILDIQGNSQPPCVTMTYSQIGR